MSSAETSSTKERPRYRPSLIQPTMLSHGTLECRRLETSRRFYQEFLGFETVQTGPASGMLRLGGYWVIVLLEVGDSIQPNSQGHHYGLDMPSIADVDRAHEITLAHQGEYGIQKVTRPRNQHGVYSFFIQDLDGNWWEYQYTPERHYDKVFEQGDLAGAGLHDKSRHLK
jgi:catechol 2,3-dioxygenase-like lactoylglutathione lyase family enzyme